MQNFHKIRYSDIVKSEKTWYTMRDGNEQCQTRSQCMGKRGLQDEQEGDFE